VTRVASAIRCANRSRSPATLTSLRTIGT
jgi:hypothetical protein